MWWRVQASLGRQLEQLLALTPPSALLGSLLLYPVVQAANHVAGATNG